SRAPSRSCASVWSPSSRRLPGRRPSPRSTASTRTSTPRSAIRAGARPTSGASASSAAARPCRSTATPTRSRRSTPAWISKSSTRPVTRRTRVALKVGAWAGGLAPLLLLGYRAWTDDLGANPISFITTTLGDWTLRILLASLAMTPLRIVFGLSWPITLRRLLGLFALAYVGLHVSAWIVLHFLCDCPRVGAEVGKRPFLPL